MPSIKIEQRGDSLAKRLEITARKLLTKVFSRSEGTILIDKPVKAFFLSDRPSLLLLRQDKIGDALISIPVIRELRKNFPLAKIDVLLGESNFAIRAALSAYINDVLLYSKKASAILRLLRKLRKRKYDVVIDLMDNASATSTALVRFCGARYSVGIQKSNSAAYSHITPLLNRSSVHIVERIAQLLLPFNIDPDRAVLDLEYTITSEESSRAAKVLSLKDDQFLIALNISSSSNNRLWDDKHWIILAQLLAKSAPNARIIGFSAPRQRAQLLRIALAAPIEAATMTESFHDFAALLSLSNGIVTPDTSIVHLAAAWKIPCAAMFVRSDPNILPWVPYNSPHRSFFTYDDIRNISPYEVAEACAELFFGNTKTG